HETGRTNNILKIKVCTPIALKRDFKYCQSIEDSERRVLGVLPTGLWCQQYVHPVAWLAKCLQKNRPNGLKVMVECFQQDVDNPPQIGSVITVKHARTYTNGR